MLGLHASAGRRLLRSGSVNGPERNRPAQGAHRRGFGRCLGRGCSAGVSTHAPPRLWPQVASGTGCAANWFAGAPGGLGDPSAPPQWGLPGAPALLGFDRDVLAACHALHGVTGEKASAVGTADFDAALALGCFAARQHVLRVSAELEPRTACQMLEWTTCAARGLLPGQDGRRIRFAVAPSELDTRAWIRPGEECVAGSCGVREANFAASDLHFVQARRLSPP